MGQGPAIILLHGNSETHEIFDVLIPRLAKDHTVYAVDSRCHGQSENTERISYELMCDGKRVSAEIDVKKIERKISLSEASDAESEKMLVPVLDVTLHGKVKLKDYPDGYDENAVIAAAEQMIKDVCSQGREAVSAYPCDALGILRMLKRYQNEFYNRSSGEYESLLGRAAVNIEVELDITE